MTHLLDLLQPENSKFYRNEFPDSTPCSEISVIMAQHSNNFPTAELSKTRALTDSVKGLGETDPQCTDDEKQNLIKKAIETREKSENIIRELKVAVTDFGISAFEKIYALTNNTRFYFDTA